ncbi:hypothetical protein PTKIN_Ptkin13bG0096800 [Pterospermum kingtungense]
MAASSLASPLWTWLVATSPMFQSPKRQNHGLTPEKLLLISCKRSVTQEKPQEKKRLVTPLGDDPDIFYNNLLQGVSGISEIQNSDTSQLPTKIGEIKCLSTDGYVASKLAKRADRYMLYLLTAGKKAVADAGITDEVNKELNKAKCGTIIGSAMGGLRIFHDWFETMLTLSKMPNPFSRPLGTLDMGSALLAIDLGWMGPNYVISSGGSTSSNCILRAAAHIIKGNTDMMLCGGSEAGLHPFCLGGAEAMRCLSQRNCDPTKVFCPWNTDRDGIVVGEGAGVLVLEELEHAKQRSAKVYAEFLGGNSATDAYHITQPHPDAREDVNYINAHAASTKIGDLIEITALIRCFGNNPVLRINSTKSMIGHLQRATGAVEVIAAVKAIQTGWIHPNINLDNPDKGVDINLLVGPKKERLDVKIALSNSFGLGGQNSSILFAPLKEQDSQQKPVSNSA